MRTTIRSGLYIMLGVALCYLIAMRGPEIIAGLYLGFQENLPATELLLTVDASACQLAQEKIAKMTTPEKKETLIPFYKSYLPLSPSELLPYVKNNPLPDWILNQAENKMAIHNAGDFAYGCIRQSLRAISDIHVDIAPILIEKLAKNTKGADYEVINILKPIVEQNPEIQSLVLEAFDKSQTVPAARSISALMMQGKPEFNIKTFDYIFKIPDEHFKNKGRAFSDFQNESNMDLAKAQIMFGIVQNSGGITLRNAPLIMKHPFISEPKKVWVIENLNAYYMQSNTSTSDSAEVLAIWEPFLNDPNSEFRDLVIKKLSSTAGSTELKLKVATKEIRSLIPVQEPQSIEDVAKIRKDLKHIANTIQTIFQRQYQYGYERLGTSKEKKDPVASELTLKEFTQAITDYALVFTKTKSLHGMELAKEALDTLSKSTINGNFAKVYISCLEYKHLRNDALQALINVKDPDEETLRIIEEAFTMGNTDIKKIVLGGNYRYNQEPLDTKIYDRVTKRIFWLTNIDDVLDRQLEEFFMRNKDAFLIQSDKILKTDKQLTTRHFVYRYLLPINNSDYVKDLFSTDLKSGCTSNFKHLPRIFTRNMYQIYDPNYLQDAMGAKSPASGYFKPNDPTAEEENKKLQKDVFRVALMCNPKDWSTNDLLQMMIANKEISELAKSIHKKEKDKNKKVAINKLLNAAKNVASPKMRLPTYYHDNLNDHVEGD